eukprot:TRINITY_DN321_c1_g3_i2.p1 TRINITY_DN321_c1_g3~~TRINITY_DN321_c1_g3_i2.p1  ORF type:complete len:980 (-),score=215.52 TRINITY_DN321_c1_g3_i2:2222-5161(-)
MANLMDSWGVGDDSSVYGSLHHPAIDEDFVEALSQKEANLKAKETDPDQQPIFSFEQVDYRVSNLKHMSVCSNLIVMAIENGTLHRLHLSRPQDVKYIEVTKEPIHKIFLDPTGKFLIISVLGHHPENYFLHASWDRPRVLSKMRGIVINSVAWDRSIPDNASITGEILIGTSNGMIFQAVIDAKEGKEKVFKLVYSMNDENPVTGLRYEKFPHDPPRYFIMATTPSRIYQFVGGPHLELVFESYQTNPGFHELPSGISYSELAFFSKYGSNGLPIHFAWLTGVGLYHGTLLFASQSAGDLVSSDTQLLSYPSKVPGVLPKPPVALSITEFHFLLLFEDRFMAICRLNEQIVCDLELPKRLGRPRGLSRDPVESTVWLYFENGIFEIVINNEDRNAWELYLEKAQYELALQYCREPWQQDKVYVAQADRYFSQKNFDLAAQFYGKTKKSFEEVALKFIQANERDALKTFLIFKLSSLSRNDQTQQTIICTWLVEIFLNKLNQLKDSGNVKGYESFQEEFRHFLEERHSYLNPATTFHLILSHGRIGEMLMYATLIGDHERVVSHLIQNHKYLQALEVMVRHVSEEIFYKFAPILMSKVPYQCVNVLLAVGTGLNPRKLIPALMRYNPKSRRMDPKAPPEEREHQAIRYLRHVVEQNRDPAIHNYLLSLYAEQDNDAELIEFLQAPNSVYDLKYAIRLATKYNKIRACVLIYSGMGLYEEAVDLALKVDLELAKENADRPEDDPGLRKKLWLKIARHVVEEEKDIKKAMAFLNQCELLKIEDILPFFPDFVLIDDFKQEICASLEDYNLHIENLKKEMDEATQSADAIRKDIKNIRNKYGFVKEDKKCDICGYLVLTRQFYLFPCQHIFHADCLIKEMMNHLSNTKQNRVKDIRDKMANIANSANTQKGGAGNWSLLQSLALSSDDSAVVPQMTSAEQLKAELDDLCASDCIYCSEIMIKSIDEPFVGENESAAIRSWLI